MAEEKYLNIKETSRFLKISISTLNRLIKQRGIPSYKIGDRRLFDREELVDWMKARRGNEQRLI
jgi:excisionase family DNA binding protein